MSSIAKAVLWASIILAFALFASSSGMSSAASTGIVLGLSGAAWGSLHADTPCGGGCVQ